MAPPGGSLPPHNIVQDLVVYGMRQEALPLSTSTVPLGKIDPALSGSPPFSPTAQDVSKGTDSACDRHLQLTKQMYQYNVLGKAFASRANLLSIDSVISGEFVGYASSCGVYGSRLRQRHWFPRSAQTSEFGRRLGLQLGRLLGVRLLYLRYVVRGRVGGMGLGKANGRRA
jgi:hypothetical protein